MKIKSISTTSHEFPKKLCSIPDAPRSLCVIGKLPDSSQKAISIVGTRKPTAYGSEVTWQLAERLAERGVNIISGLALGVDALAHRGALKGNGTTYAVLACGVDTPYPRTNSQLAEEIIKKGGGIISEYAPGTPPVPYRFLERNRIVSGLGDALVVTEAAIRSGTFNTVSHALAQGRDVYAVPGPITSPMSSGCNQLIAQGAAPIISIDDFVEHFALRESVQTTIFAYDANEQILIDLLQSGIRDGDGLQQKSQLEAGLFAQTMTMLEIRGVIKPLGANRWSL